MNAAIRPAGEAAPAAAVQVAIESAEGNEIVFGNLAQNFGRVDYLMSLPIILLTLFALGILLIDLMLPAEWKWTNAVTALVGILFSAAGVVKIQLAFNAAGVPGESAFLNSLVVDHFTIYFWYLFLAAPRFPF